MLIARTHPHFARLLVALATSQFGDWLYNLALLAYVEERTHSTTWLGMTTAARIAPMVAGSPLGGLIADRFDRRRLMVGSDAIRAAIMAALGLVVAAGLPVALVPLLAASSTLAGVVYPPAVAAVTPRLVDAEMLPAANAARGSITPVCVAAGPALGALLLLIGSPELVFALNAATFIVSGLIVLSITADLGGAGPGCAPVADAASTDGGAGVAAVISELRAGAGALRAAPGSVPLVAADVAGSLVYGAQTVLLLLVAERLGLGAAGYGYLLGAQGAGGIAGATLAGRLGDAGGRRSTLMIALAMVALPLPVLAFTTSVGVAIVVSVIAGAGALMAEVAADIRLQRTLDETRIGCAYGFVFSVSIGGMLAGSLIAPMLVAIAGVGGALCLIAAAVLALALGFAWRAAVSPRAGRCAVPHLPPLPGS